MNHNLKQKLISHKKEKHRNLIYNNYRKVEKGDSRGKATTEQRINLE